MPKQKQPEAAVGALIFNPKGEIFLMKSHKWNNKYTIPGGHIKFGEKMEDALKRETKEETSLIVHSIEFICFFESLFDKAFWKKKHFLFFVFSCKTDSPKVRMSSEGEKPAWVSLKKALSLPISKYTRIIIKEYLKKSKKKKTF